MTTRVVIVSAKGYRRDREKLDESVWCFEQALNHPLFEAAMVGFRASARMPRMLRTGGLSQREVLAALRGGWPRSEGRRRPVIELDVELDPEVEDGVVGATMAGKIYTNPKWFRKHPASWMAGHLAHEYAHILGFTHAYQPKPRRHLTVPYAAGELITEVARCILEEEAEVSRRQVDAVLRAVGSLPRYGAPSLRDRLGDLRDRIFGA